MVTSTDDLQVEDTYSPKNKNNRNDNTDDDIDNQNDEVDDVVRDISIDNEDEDDELYGNIDDLKLMISDDENPDLENDIYGKNYYDSPDDALLAEFSDYDSVSEDDEQDFMDAIREANNFKVKRKRKNKKIKKSSVPFRRERPVDPEVALLASEANEAFVRNDLVVAERLFNEIIKKDARNFAAYETLGDIYQLQNRMNDCCNSWFLAAHLNSSDWSFWKMVANLSVELNHIRQAIYCYSRVININHQDLESLYKRSVLYRQIGQIGRALEGFQKLHKYNPLDNNILRELAVLYVDYNRIGNAIGLYINVFKANIARREAIILASESVFDSSDEESSEEFSSDEDDEDESEDYEDEQGNRRNKSKKKNKKKKKQNQINELLKDFDTARIAEDEDLQMYPELNWKKLNAKHRCILFDWSSLNILAELYLKQPSENSKEGIKMIKRCARWIQRREQQLFWEDVIDDSECDDRRYKNAKFDALTDNEKNKEYHLPIDIRIRLGLLRLNNDQLLEALNHFHFLYDENFLEISDLYFEVGQALQNSENYEEAVDYFLPLLALEDFNKTELFRPLGKCYKELENYSMAKEYFEKLVEVNPTDIDDVLTLAELEYHLGNTDEFNNLLKKAVKLRKQQAEELDNIAKEYEKEESKSPEEKEAENAINPHSKPLLEDSMFRQAITKKKKTLQDIERERFEREKKISSKVLDKYNKLKSYRPGFETGNKTQITMWIDIASDLIDVFSSVKNFFMKSRSKKFVGIIRRTKRFNKLIDSKLERLSKLSSGDNLLDGLPLMEESVRLTSTTELRGLTYDQWFELFMELSLIITKYQNIEDGLSVIETAQEVNVFNQDSNRVKTMRFVKCAIVLRMKDPYKLAENLRVLLNQYQFNRKVLQIFLYCLSEGNKSMEILSSTVQQKFFLRQLKAFDGARYNTHVSGQASLTNKQVLNVDKKSSPYLFHIYAMLLYSSKGFLSALQYLNWMERDIPNDPMVNLMMGLSHLHRSMQRLTAKRHFQVLHGLRYMFKYYDIRSENYSDLEKQEADYNIGRAFHLLNLLSIAVHFYHRVLENYEDDTLKKHAAYNCVMIYQESGNFDLASSIMEKYLTI
ncbi:hypothetical protein TBLA_0A05500 [Henningerozyma blattae CBS 6284]|uniref:Transcription factor tau 131 kDa subunit n=1 Tax=Henningerozyma blattae (strain ATCC 34711 / CBS 6284 / DSM 70876 / NBRC 10599 / NRRL Y-10934 / UCD 77-7) TaxID=1071380 RepID=I2GW41_HENB6|nr:hypothetical protein TBLA_0A05500 [Tetrapisispora blattae CBS 6284]CCH58343.1 hypothetical protein TBLA_0A05500 [Tetrapisispora blattae CBS 6284]